jgi:hypothetical protein
MFPPPSRRSTFLPLPVPPHPPREVQHHQRHEDDEEKDDAGLPALEICVTEFYAVVGVARAFIVTRLDWVAILCQKCP